MRGSRAAAVMRRHTKSLSIGVVCTDDNDTQVTRSCLLALSTWPLSSVCRLHTLVTLWSAAADRARAPVEELTKNLAEVDALLAVAERVSVQQVLVSALTCPPAGNIGHGRRATGPVHGALARAPGARSFNAHRRRAALGLGPPVPSAAKYQIDCYVKQGAF